jgi:deoxyribonuclease-4
VPVARGLARAAVPHAERVGAEVVQVFVSNPRGWARAAGDPRQDAAFRDWAGGRGVPVFVHAPYLVNLGSPDPRVRELSAGALAHALDRGAALGAAGVVVHAGSSVDGDRAAGLCRVRAALLPLLDRLPAGGPRVLVEPTAGGGAALASTVDTTAAYVAALDGHPRLGLCLDTCHLHAAGHDLAAPGGARRLVAALTRAVGRPRLGLVHANDSRDERGSTRDRHASVGAGAIGAAGFGELLAAVRGVPVLVETEDTAHAADIATLKALRDGLR